MPHTARRSATTLAALVAAAGLALAPMTAHAAATKKPKPPTPPPTPTKLVVTYDVNGSTFIAKPKSTVKLGPTTITTTLESDGSFTGTLPIPSTTAKFNIIGLLPTSATVDFIPAAPTTGKLGRDGDRVVVTSTSSYYVKLSNVVVGFLPAFVGDNCKTASPITVPANTPAGQSFSVDSGGTLTGTYTLGSFANCGLTTSLINQLVPGPNNTISLTLANGRQGTA